MNHVPWVVVSCLMFACGGSPDPLPSPDAGAWPEWPAPIAGDWGGVAIAYIGANTRIEYRTAWALDDSASTSLTGVCPVSEVGVADGWRHEPEALYWDGNVSCPVFSHMGCDFNQVSLTEGVIRPLKDGGMTLVMSGRIIQCGIVSTFTAMLVGYRTSQ